MDFIGKVRHDLDCEIVSRQWRTARTCIRTCLPKVIAATLLVNDMLVDLASRDVVILSEGHSKVAFVIPEIQIGFTPVV